MTKTLAANILLAALESLQKEVREDMEAGIDIAANIEWEEGIEDLLSMISKLVDYSKREELRSVKFE